MIRLRSRASLAARSSSLIRPRDIRAHIHRHASENAGKSRSRTPSWKPWRAAHAWQAASSAGTRKIVLPGSRGSRRQRARSRLRSNRIRARWIRVASPERPAAVNRVRWTVPQLCRKQVEPPRILAALHGSPSRLVAEQRGISRPGPLQNRARPIMKFSRCSVDRNPRTRPVRSSRHPPSEFMRNFLGLPPAPIIS